jgi:large subunit ribosomal protein L1
VDKNASLGVGVGKRSFSTEEVVGNLTAIMEAIGKARPAAFKGRYIKSAYVSATQTPSVKLASSEYAKY